MGHCCSQQKQFMDQVYKHLNITYKNSLPEELTILLEKLNKKISRCNLLSCTNCCTQLQKHDKVPILSDSSNKGILHIPTQYFYYGELSKEKEEEGLGMAFYKNFIFYNGQFHDGLYHGRGQLCMYDRLNNILPIQTGKWHNGQLIQGDISPHPLCRDIISIKLKNNKYQIKFVQQIEYQGQGELLDDKFIKKGRGKLINHLTGYEYDGQWVNDMREGQVFIQKINDTMFKGSFQADRKKKGTLQNNQYKYEGSWQEGGVFSGDIIHKKSNQKRSIIRNKYEQS